MGLMLRDGKAYEEGDEEDGTEPLDEGEEDFVQSPEE